MKLTARDLVLGAALLFLAWVTYQAGDVLVPFILAGVFAFALNPVVSLLSHHVRLPRTLSVLVVYLVLIVITVTALVFIAYRLIAEVRQLASGVPLDIQAKHFIDSLPSWDIAGQTFSLQAYSLQILNGVKTFTSNLESQALTLVSGGLRFGVYFLLFLVSGFYLLKDGKKIKNGLLSLMPEPYRGDFQVIWLKLQVVLGNYLRGELLLMLIIGGMSYVLLEALGVRYALILAIIAGFLEIVPLVGPTISTAIAVAASFLTADNSFGLDPTALALSVLAGFIVIQQVENYIIVPNIFNKLTSLHPLVVMFSILIGGTVFGALGGILAVPVAASAKTVFEYFAQKQSS